MTIENGREMDLGQGEKEYIMRHTRPREPCASQHTGIHDSRVPVRTEGTEEGRIVPSPERRYPVPQW